MIMKRLFRNIPSLLRTALLLGALALFDIATQAQPVSITAEMPDAFETKTPVVGDGEYYYIQFYKEETYPPYLYQSFLGELGEGVQMQAMDYLPFASNRLWTLVKIDDTEGNKYKYKLKSKRGFYAYYDNNRFYTTATEANATVFTYKARGSFRSGFYELLTDGGVQMGRWSKGGEWSQMINVGSNNSVGFVRFAKLKPTAAHIIYYRGEGEDNTDPNIATTRHYLTCSDADAEISVSVIFNGNLEANLGGGDASCFYIGDPSSTTPKQATITNGIGVDGSKGISVTSGATDDPHEWDTQFFIRSKDVIPAGKTIHVEFDYKASAAVSEVHTQAHAEPGVYRDYGTFGSLDFTTEWKRYERDITVTEAMGNDFRTIVLDLYKNNAGVVYYFDNIVVTAPITSEVSSRRSIIPSDKSLWTLPTAAAYHQDGLWVLEEASNDGQFYIKKYGEERYLTIRQITDYNYCTILGDKEDLYGKFELETPTANRYTRIHNVCPLWGLGRYLSYLNGDGSFVMQGPYYDNSWWNAGFYPVEVPVSQKDEFFQVRLILNPPYGTQEDRIPIYLNPGKHDDITLNSTLRSDGENIIGAKYTPSGAWQNCFQYKDGNALTIPSGYQKIVIRFASPVPAGWGINGIVPDGSGWKQGWEAIPEGSMYYEMNLTGQINGSNITTITDFTIFSTATSSAIEIAEIYFYKGDMLNNTNGSSMPSSEANPSLWQLEQVDDYTQFRLKNPTTGKYLSGNGQMTESNDPYGEAYEGARKAERNTNEKFWTDFTPKWYIPTERAEKEIRVNHYVRHKESYLRTYADDQVITNQEGLKKQGLSSDIDSDWKNFNGNLDGFTQNVNHFEITHYVKKGNSKVIEFPTVLNKNNDHIFFQRFYHYDEVDTSMDLDNLKAHVSLDTRDDGDVQYFLYNNGMVTGQKLDWRTYNNGTYTAIPDGGMARNEQRRFNFTNSDGQPFTVAVDVSRYSDLKYLNTTDHLAGDLEEPSLTMRYLFNMRDAKDMANSLTACTENSGKWLEEKTFHYGRTQVPYTKFKKVGYRGEFIGLRHIFSDYWVFDGNGTGDDNLVSAVNSNSEGKIVVEIYDPNKTGIRLGGYNPNIDLNSEDENNNGNDADYQGFYFYDKLSPSPKTEYGNSRFVVFRYPASGIVDNYGPDKPAYIRVYLKNGDTKYQLAQFTVIFDANMATRPWTEIKNGTSYANNVNQVKGTSRDPNQLRDKAGLPIAKITFDFPQKMMISESEVNATYHYPSTADCPSTDGMTRHNGGNNNPGGIIQTIYNNKTYYSSPVPLTFGHTNYSFDGDGCNWGSYSIVTGKKTTWGNDRMVLPADDETYGYDIDADDGMQKAFLYIDASEQPGDICAVEFEGEFCANDQLMCTGWISGSNKIRNDTRCPGSITLTVKGEDANGNTNTIYRFCPGQIYELDNGYEMPGATVGNAGIDGNGNSATHVVWQQFYFEFSTDKKYERYWLEVNNNCVSSNGGDFMLDNIEVYTIVPEVIPEINTPLCVERDANNNLVYDMRFLKLKIDYNKLLSSAIKQGSTTQTPYLGLVFLEKEKFLTTLRQELGATSISLDEMAERVESGYYDNVIDGSDTRYQNAFNAALLRTEGNTNIWHSDDDPITTNMGAGVMYFKWDKTYANMEPYSFYKAVTKTHATFRETEDDVEWIILNGNYPQLPWKTNTDYYVVPTNTHVENFSLVYDAFNICSNCSKASVFRIEPPYNVLGLEKSEDTNDYVVCEGQIPTMLLDLKGYDFNGNEVPMKDINYDWWLGDRTRVNPNDPTQIVIDPDAPSVPRLKATLENYHSQAKNGIRLDDALSTLRAYYPDVTDLTGVMEHVAVSPNHALTLDMLNYLQELIGLGQLVLHQKSISVPAEPAGAEDPYYYLVACPIHDDSFTRALNPQANEYVAYYCDEPQGIRVKVGDKAPTLKTGFVPGENTFSAYNYPTDSDPVLSIRLAKKEQFEKVQHGKVSEVPVEPTASNAETIHYLWLPIRNAMTQTASGVIKKSDDYNVYLASTNDPIWDKRIYKAMNGGNGSLPIVGKIVQLYATNTKGADETETESLIAAQNDKNRLCIYFIKYLTENDNLTDEQEDDDNLVFTVREGYNYTLSLPFQEDDGKNACDGTILINVKIVPDYEVWTGAAGNTDWNNDENWRRADGNTTSSTGLNADELYVGAVTAGSPLEGYKTNAWNYRSAKDRVFRKGFAPLYCTHVLMMSDEWGNAPVLYDAIDGNALNTTTNSRLTNAPFPNLRDKDGWDGTTGDNITKATATPILRYDMQARLYDIWSETYGEGVLPNKGRSGDLIAEMYQINCCDEIAFQPGTELRNAHLLNYNTAWVEYELDTKRWYLLGSPLQGTISGEWYAPTGNSPQQKTTYYDPIIFDASKYDRYSPAIYQRSWDKAKAVLYEVGSTYNTGDNPDDQQLNNDGTMPGFAQQGGWNGSSWNATGADEYLDRLGYKPLEGNKANVAIQGIWSNTYNDATVDYTKGGFSVMVLNHLKGNSENVKAIIRLPKEDTMYDYWNFDKDISGTNTDLEDVRDVLSRNLNRGRLKTDLLLPTSTQRTEDTDGKFNGDLRYGEERTITRIPLKEVDLTTMLDGIREHQEAVSAGISNMGFYMVENPFPCGLNMDMFFAANTGLEKKYWLLTADGQHLVQKAADSNEWVSPSGTDFVTANTVVAPGQGFFVQATTPGASTTIIFNKEMQAQTRFGVESGNPRTFTIEVGREQVTKTETIEIDDDDDPTTDPIQVTVEEIVYEEDGVTPKTTPITQDVTIYNYVQTSEEDYQYPLRARNTRSAEVSETLPGLVITAQRSDMQSRALVMQREGASNDFLPEEDTETFITSDFESVPTVFTLCGRLATTINSIHDFRSLPVGVESNSDVPCVLTFQGVEMLGDSISFYDAVEQTLTPLQSGMQFSVSGQTQNRYYLVRSLIQEEAAAETHLQIFTEGLTAKVIASTAEPIVSVRCFDTAGRLIHSASPQTAEYSFTLPIAGIYIIEAETENDRKTKKVMAK